MEQSKPYYACCVYPSKKHSGNAQTIIRYIAYVAKLSLSVYPLTDGKRYFLAVVGETPSEQIKLRIHDALLSGRPVKLPNHLLSKLIERHQAETGVTKKLHTQQE